MLAPVWEFWRKVRKWLTLKNRLFNFSIIWVHEGVNLRSIRTSRAEGGKSTVKGSTGLKSCVYGVQMEQKHCRTCCSWRRTPSQARTRTRMWVLLCLYKQDMLSEPTRQWNDVQTCPERRGVGMTTHCSLLVMATHPASRPFHHGCSGPGSPGTERRRDKKTNPPDPTQHPLTSN